MRNLRRPPRIPEHWGGILDGDLANLPKDHRGQWGLKRKALVVEAVRCGHLSFPEAQRRYRMTLHEFRSWKKIAESLRRKKRPLKQIDPL